MKPDIPSRLMSCWVPRLPPTSSVIRLTRIQWNKLCHCCSIVYIVVQHHSHHYLSSGLQQFLPLTAVGKEREDRCERMGLHTGRSPWYQKHVWFGVSHAAWFDHTQISDDQWYATATRNEVAVYVHESFSNAYGYMEREDTCEWMGLQTWKESMAP